MCVCVYMCLCVYSTLSKSCPAARRTWNVYEFVFKRSYVRLCSLVDSLLLSSNCRSHQPTQPSRLNSQTPIRLSRGITECCFVNSLTCQTRVISSPNKAKVGSSRRAKTSLSSMRKTAPTLNVVGLRRQTDG